MKRVIDCISKLKTLTREQVLENLKVITDLSPEEKNLIYFYLFPRPLLDKELPSRFYQLRGERNKVGSIKPDLNESTLIIEAGKTSQYGRFIKHLFHSYSKQDTIFPIEGSDIDTCCLCGKEIYEVTLWKSFSKQYGKPEEDEKLYLAYGSTESNLPICLPCLINLLKSIEIMKDIEPDFLRDYNMQNSDQKPLNP